MTNSIENFALVLFDQAQNQKKIPAYVNSTKLLLSVLGDDIKLNEIISNRFHSKEERKNLIEEIFNLLKINNLKHFVFVVIDMDHSTELVKILKTFLTSVDKFYNKPTIEIISAFPLTNVQVKAIIRSVEKRLNKKINHTVTVDKNIIGGIKVVGQGFIFDNTISTKLENMKGMIA